MTPGRNVSWPLRIVAALALAAAGVHAYVSVMSGIFSLDEGYLMITVQSSVEGNSLYDVVYTQYGPFYYLYEWLVHAVLRVPITHDATRLLTVAHWLITAGCMGFASARMLKSNWFGLFVFMQATAHLGAMSNEPGHPQELVAVMLGLAMLALTHPRITGEDASPFEPRNFYWLAAIAAALVLIKINVGVLFGIALATVVAWRGLGWFNKPPWSGLFIAACSALPFVLMRRHLNAPWCLHYAVVVGCTVVSVMLAALISSNRPTPGFHFGRLVAAFVVPLAVMLLGTVLTGTTLHGLLDGLVLTPLKTPSIALLPLKLPSAVMVNAIAALVLAGACFTRPESEKVRALTLWLKGLFGIVGSFAFVGIGELELGWLLPWMWLAIVPGRTTPRDTSLIFLCLAAIWQGLQAYPIAGSQVAFGTLLLVPLYAACLKDVADFAVSHPRVQKELSAPSAAKLVPQMPMLGGAALLGLFIISWLELPAVWRHYNTYEPLNLPGSRLMRFDPEGAKDMRRLMQYLSNECDTFITYPGYNSFYFWSGKRPPTHLNATGWGLLRHSQQEFILEAVRKAKRPKIVVITELVKNWPNGIPEPLAPLGKFVLTECRVVRQDGGFTILELKGDRAGPAR